MNQLLKILVIPLRCHTSHYLASFYSVMNEDLESKMMHWLVSKKIAK